MIIYDDEEYKIDKIGEVLIKQVDKAIALPTDDKSRNKEIENAMNNMYDYFSTFPETELQKFGLQIKIFEVEQKLSKEFLPLKSEPVYDPDAQITFPTKLDNTNDFEKALEFIVHSARKILESQGHNIKTDPLKGRCIDTSYEIDQLCKKMHIKSQNIGVNQELKPGYFHHFVIAQFQQNDGNIKKYLVDCTYRQFFTKNNYLPKRISVTRGPGKGISIGAFMTADDERKKVAEELLTNGFIEATPEVMKMYFDSIVFSSHDLDYYKSKKIYYMDPDNWTLNSSLDDYLNFIAKNHNINPTSIVNVTKEILTSKKIPITTKDVTQSNITDKTIEKGVNYDR